MTRMQDIARRLNLHEERFNAIDERLLTIVARLDSHDGNHHGKKSTAIQTSVSGGGAVLLLGILAAILKALGVSY